MHLTKNTFVVLLSAFMLLISASICYAQEPQKILSNSEDWKDVYSVMQFGVLKQVSSSFLVSNRHSTLILNQIPKTNHIWVFSSKKVPFVVGYQNLLQSKGYSSEEFEYDNINLELAKQLDDVSQFIILDDAYGYNAVSVAPYAAATRSYVLFADSDNIRDVERFLSERQVAKIIIYGQTDREVRSSLDKYSPEVINKEGDRFLNNIEILKKYQEIKHSKQAILTNGEFIEQEIMSGSEPVVFIGTNNVPDAIREYVQSSDIQVGVLIGNELVSTATFIRRQIGISVFVKFAQGSRAPQGSISQVEALDMFYLPVYNLNLEIDSIKYNRATNQLEVTLKNTQEQAIYFIGTYSLTASDGTKFTVGDVGPTFIDGRETKTMVYDVESLAEGKLTVDIFVIYGESKGSLEKEIRSTIEVETVQVLDECQIQINGVSLNPGSRTFYIDTENIGPKDCYVDMELIDIVIAGQKISVGMDSVVLLKPGQKRDLRIKVADFQKDDVLDNENIKLRAYYGERETSLVRIIEGTFEVTVKSTDYVFYSLIIVIIILIFLIVWKRRADRKKKEKSGAGRQEPAKPEEK